MAKVSFYRKETDWMKYECADVPDVEALSIAEAVANAKFFEDGLRELEDKHNFEYTAQGVVDASGAAGYNVDGVEYGE